MYIFATEHDTAWATWQHTQDNSLHLPTHTNTRRRITAYTACLSVRGTFYAAGMPPLAAPYMRRQKPLPAVPHKGHGHASNAGVLVVVNSQSYDRATTCPSASVMQQTTDARLQSSLAAGILHSAGRVLRYNKHVSLETSNHNPAGVAATAALARAQATRGCC